MSIEYDSEYGRVVTYSPDFFKTVDFRQVRTKKGDSLLAFPTDLVVVDLETTGLDPTYCDIIEIACLRVRDMAVVDSFSSLVRPFDEIDPYITDLTGITNEMVSSAPSIEDILPTVKDFIGSDIVLGQNAHFDVNFLYDNFAHRMSTAFSNDFVDTMRLSQRMLPDLGHYRLADIAAFFEIAPDGSHRALADCETTFACYRKLFEIASASGNLDEFADSLKNHKKRYDMSAISTNNTDFDETHPLFGKHCVFTGVLENMTRSQAAQIVVDLGGICENTVTKSTNYLILGNNDFCSTIKDGKSTKQKKAEAYRLKGQDIEVLSENVFYDLVLAHSSDGQDDGNMM